MEKYRNEKRSILTVPRTTELHLIYEFAAKGAKLKGCTPEEFVIEALELALEEERKKR